MFIGNRIKITSEETANYVMRDIQTQEQLDKYRGLEGYGIEVLPVIHSFTDSSCVSCEGWGIVLVTQ